MGIGGERQQGVGRVDLPTKRGYGDVDGLGYGNECCGAGSEQQPVVNLTTNLHSATAAAKPRSEYAAVSSHPYARWGKRAFDVVAVAVLLVVLSPVLLLVAVSIPVMLGPGGVVYRQQRVGRHGRAFTIYKFRSMLVDRRSSSVIYLGEDRRKDHKTVHDPRHTDFGRLLRATSLDELPQLLNVLRGDMSLVGPRPELVDVAIREGYFDHPRHLVRPGITGLFQTSPLRSINRIKAGLHLDLDYVGRVRLGRDIMILMRTATLLLLRRGS